ncbi:hypothetical protein M758_10G163200 [Ceratodon purpureus]|nr:hypothetical protein M758_10G163200 [Ceratodon purpureus]
MGGNRETLGGGEPFGDRSIDHRHSRRMQKLPTKLTRTSPNLIDSLLCDQQADLISPHLPGSVTHMPTYNMLVRLVLEIFRGAVAALLSCSLHYLLLICPHSLQASFIQRLFLCWALRFHVFKRVNVISATNRQPLENLTPVSGAVSVPD